MAANRFDNVQYDYHSNDLQKEFKNKFQELETWIENSFPTGGRSKSLALTALEEAYMWIGKAIRDDQISREQVEKARKVT